MCVKLTRRALGLVDFSLTRVVDRSSAPKDASRGDPRAAPWGSGMTPLGRVIVVCLDVDECGAFEGCAISARSASSNPAEMAARYEQSGAEQIVLLDISASATGRETQWDTYAESAERLLHPAHVRRRRASVADVRPRRCGWQADKVAVNSAASAGRDQRSLRLVGAQCICFRGQSTATIDCTQSGWRVFVQDHGALNGAGRSRRGRRNAWTSGQGRSSSGIDRDGGRSGIRLTHPPGPSLVSVPVVAPGARVGATRLRFPGAKAWPTPRWSRGSCTMVWYRRIIKARNGRLRARGP